MFLTFVREKYGKLKAGEKVKYTVCGKTSLWNAEIVEYPLKQNKKRKKSYFIIKTNYINL